MPLTRDARLGLDRDDVAAVAQRDDRLLEGVAELRADERVEPPPQPVVGDPDGRPQAAQARRGRVEQLADRVEAARERAAERRQRRGARGRGRAAAARRSSASDVARRAVASSVSAISRNWAGIEPAAAGRPLDRRADVVRRADADARAAPRAATGPGRSRRAGGPRRPGPTDGSSASARRRDGGNEVAAASRSRTSGNSSRACERASISPGRAASARPGAARTRTGGRRSRTATAAPAQSVAGVADADPRADRDPLGGDGVAGIAGSRSRRSGLAGSHRSDAGPAPCRRRTPRRRGPGRWRAAGPACGPGARARPRRPASVRAARRRRSDASRSARIRSMPAAARRRGSAPRTAAPSGPVTTFRQSYIP